MDRRQWHIFEDKTKAIRGSRKICVYFVFNAYWVVPVMANLKGFVWEYLGIGREAMIR